ncbi:RHS domain-containing protein, partial [Citrobacter farmeri]|uniref:RHS repeat-associated core domain-containing protein n=2 Tax=Citrobacter farmeri TaxID=67824 RepID=UPI00190465EC
TGAVTQARYQYDPYGRRISKTVRRHHQSDTTRYGWDGDRLVMTEKSGHKVYTLYEPNTFTPLLRIESDGGDEPYTPLADKLRQHSQIPFTAQEYADMERLEDDLRTGKLSERSRSWLEFANIPAHLMAAQLDPLPVVNIRNIHLYQCDHRGMPVALINREGQTEWKAEADPWGELLSEENPHNIEQPLRLPGQWYDEESELHYNRHRYYDPQQGRYISQDPIGLKGEWNLYQYPLDPVGYVDPLGLKECTGSARVLQGNSRLVGKGGGYNTNPSDLAKYGVTTDSTAIIPSQWGFTDKPSARGKINSISGKLKDGGAQLFSCVRDIVDDAALRKKKVDPQQKLMDKNPGKLILEIPGLEKDMGVQDVIITIPDGMVCPSGTQ